LQILSLDILIITILPQVPRTSLVGKLLSVARVATWRQRQGMAGRAGNHRQRHLYHQHHH